MKNRKICVADLLLFVLFEERYQTMFYRSADSFGVDHQDVIEPAFGLKDARNCTPMASASRKFRQLACVLTNCNRYAKILHCRLQIRPPAREHLRAPSVRRSSKQP